MKWKWYIKDWILKSKRNKNELKREKKKENRKKIRKMDEESK